MCVGHVPSYSVFSNGTEAMERGLAINSPVGLADYFHGAQVPFRLGWGGVALGKYGEAFIVFSLYILFLCSFTNVDIRN